MRSRTRFLKRTQRTALGVVLAATFSASGCSSRSEPPQPTPQGSAKDATPAATPAASGTSPSPGDAAITEACPTAVPGTTARATDVEGGAALEVTTTGDVASVRTRARRMAEHHTMHMDHPPMDHPMSAEGERHGPMRGRSGPGHGPRMGGEHGGVAMDARVEEMPGGARIVLTPRDASDLQAVREHARQLAERMAGGACPSMM